MREDLGCGGWWRIHPSTEGPHVHRHARLNVHSRRLLVHHVRVLGWPVAHAAKTQRGLTPVRAPLDRPLRLSGRGRPVRPVLAPTTVRAVHRPQWKNTW